MGKDPKIRELKRLEGKLKRLQVKQEKELNELTNRVEDLKLEILKTMKLDLIKEIFEGKCVKFYGSYAKIDEVVFHDGGIYLKISGVIQVYRDLVAYKKSDSLRLDNTNLDRIEVLPDSEYLSKLKAFEEIIKP